MPVCITNKMHDVCESLRTVVAVLAFGSHAERESFAHLFIVVSLTHSVTGMVYQREDECQRVQY